MRRAGKERGTRVHRDATARRHSDGVVVQRHTVLLRAVEHPPRQLEPTRLHSSTVDTPFADALPRKLPTLALQIVLSMRMSICLLVALPMVRQRSATVYE